MSKKKITLIVWFVAIVMSPVTSIAADKWSKQDVLLETTWQILHIIDWGQTRYIAKKPLYWEMSPILGRYPSLLKVDIYFLIGTILHPVITHFLDKKHRVLWHTVSLAVSGVFVSHNSLIGIRMDF